MMTYRLIISRLKEINEKLGEALDDVDVIPEIQEDIDDLISDIEQAR